MFIIITLYVQQLKRNHRKRKHSEEQNIITTGKLKKNQTNPHFTLQNSLSAICSSVLQLQDTELENLLEQNLKIRHTKK